MEGKLADGKRVREEQIGSQVKRKGDAVRVKWPTRATMLKSAAGGDLYQRGLVEEAERTRWLKELAKQIKEADTCDVSGADHGLFAARIGKGRRANTLRKHVKTWGQFIGWLTATYGVKWPERPFQFADYLISRAMEPCGRSIPVSAFKTLVVMEHAAEIPKDLQLNTAGAIKNAMEEVKLGGRPEAKETSQAAVGRHVVCLGKESYGEGRTALHQSVCLVQAGQSMGCDEISRHYWSRLWVHEVGRLRIGGRSDSHKDKRARKEDLCAEAHRQCGGLHRGARLAGDGMADLGNTLRGSRL